MKKTDRKTNYSARFSAFTVLGKISSGKAYADIALDNALSLTDEPERPLATELVYGILRNQIKIDYIIDLAVSIKTKRLEHTVLNALRLGVYQLIFLTKIPPSAAINESVNLIKKEGAKKAGFINAVLRRIDRERNTLRFPVKEDNEARAISVLYSIPEWLAKRWLERFEWNEASELCKTLLTPPPKVIRANTIVTSKDALIGELNKIGFTVAPALYAPDAIVITKDIGLNPKATEYYIQDEASQIVARLLSPMPGESVLDACAAPGGKTTHIAAIMRNAGLIIAFDRRASRLATLKNASNRLNVTIIRPVATDSAFALPLKPNAFFDAVLVDAPCSGLGVLRRSPDIKLRITEADIKDLAKKQSALLENLSGQVKKGGHLVYSVCSFEPEETDLIIKNFLKKHPEFKVENANEYLPETCAPLTDKDGFLRTFPHKHNSDGFFAARLKKV